MNNTRALSSMSISVAACLSNKIPLTGFKHGSNTCKSECRFIRSCSEERPHSNDLTVASRAEKVAQEGVWKVVGPVNSWLFRVVGEEADSRVLDVLNNKPLPYYGLAHFQMMTHRLCT